MLEWHTKQVNDIATNPLDCYWALGKTTENSEPRLYTIIEQFPVDENGSVKGDAKPELYILFEATSFYGRNKSSAFENQTEFEKWQYAESFGDYWFTNRGGFIRAFKTLDEAKQRAELQLKFIRDIIENYFPKSDEKEVS